MISGKKILQIVPEMDTGGVEQTVIDLCRALIDHGAKAYVATHQGKRITDLEAMGATVLRLPVHSKNPLTQAINYFALRDVIKTHHIDLVHVRSRAPALSAIAAAKAKKIPSVSTYHGIYNAKSALKRAYNGLMTKSDRVIANSDFTRAHILATHPIDVTRITTINRGINMDYFSPEAVTMERKSAILRDFGLTQDHKVRFLLAGRLTRWKGQHLIIEAAKLLLEMRKKAQRHTDFIILFAGDDQGRTTYRQSLEEAIEDAGLRDHIRLVGHCTDMPAAYSVCHLAIAPSLEPEAFGRTGVEPQAMCLPVLVADHGAARDTVMNEVTGLRLPPNDAQAWADGLDWALNLSPHKRQAMGQAAREQVKKRFGLSLMCDQTLSLYDDLLSN